MSARSSSLEVEKEDNKIKEYVFQVIDDLNDRDPYGDWKTQPAILQRLFVLEVHIQMTDKREIDSQVRKIEEIERDISKYKIELQKSERKVFQHESDRNMHTVKELSNIKLNIQKSKNNLRLSEGPVTQHYLKNGPDNKHVLFLILLNQLGELIMIANLDPTTQKWKNREDYYIDRGIADSDIQRDTFFLVDENIFGTAIFSDKRDYFFRIIDKVDEHVKHEKQPAYEGKTSFLTTLSFEISNQNITKITEYPRPHPFVWMGTDAANIEIIKYKIDQDADRIRYLKGCVELLNDRRKIEELRQLSQKTEYLKRSLQILEETEKFNDHSGCIDMAIEHLTGIRFYEPIVLEISSDVSQSYWDNVILKKRQKINQSGQIEKGPYNRYLREREYIDPGTRQSRSMLADIPITDRQNRILEYTHMDTFNGYRLSKNNSDRTVYDLYILQAMKGKPTILAKLTKTETMAPSQLPMSHRWINLPIQQSTPPDPNIRKVLESFHSFFGKLIDVGERVGTNKQLDYSFSIGYHEYDTQGLLHGKTGFLPQLYIHRDISQTPSISVTLDRASAYSMLEKGIRDPHIMLNSILKSTLNEDTDLSTFILHHKGVHDPRIPSMIQRKEDIESTMLSIEQQIEKNEARTASTGRDFSSALQERMSRWKWWQ